MRRVGLFLAAVLTLHSSSFAEGPAENLQVITPKDDGIIATGMNGRGEIVGFEWVEDKDRPGVVEQKPFFARGKEITYLPLLKGYTATFPAAVSDDGIVVGRASKPAPLSVRIPKRNVAFVWDARTGIHELEMSAEEWASFATGITRDGRRISGYLVGDNRVRACVWNRAGECWKCTALPHVSSQLGSNTVAISDDGRYVAAVDGAAPCLWSQDSSGRWTREVIADDGSLIPRAVNNSATVVGLRHTGDGRTHAVIWTRRQGLQTLKEPEGYVRSEANAVNNLGVVVGMVDGPGGSEIGPNAFAYHEGKLRLIHEGGPAFVTATAINDQGQVAGVLESEEGDEREPKKTTKPKESK